MIPAPIMELYEKHNVIFMLAVACLLIMLAFEGYKIFKSLLYVIGAVGFGVAGYWYIAPKVPESISNMIPDTMESSVVVAIVCALVAVFICKFAYTAMLAILGGVSGYLLGSMYVFTVLTTAFSSLDSLINNNTFKTIVGGVFAAIFIPLFILIFKHLFIVGTSAVCSIGATVVLQKILVPGASEEIKTTFLLVGVVLAIITIIRQYKEESKSVEFLL
jgi:hypothetical protein